MASQFYLPVHSASKGVHAHPTHVSVQNQQPSNFWTAQTMAVTAFRPSGPACSLDSNSPPPPPCTPGVGRKCLGEQNILLVPPCSSQAFLGKPGTGLPTSRQPIKQRVSLARLGKESQCPATPIARSRKDDPKGRAPSIFCEDISKEQSWERKGREEARCVVTSSPQPLSVCN